MQYVFRLVFGYMRVRIPSVGHNKREHRSRTGSAAEDERRADSIGSLAHPEHSPMTAQLACGVRVEPNPVIPDGEHQLSPTVVQIDYRVRCLSMFPDVGERFLHDPEALGVNPGDPARPAPSYHTERGRAVGEDATAGLLARGDKFFRLHG